MLKRISSFFTLTHLCLLTLLVAISTCYFHYAGNADYGDYYWMLGDAFMSGRTNVKDLLFDMSYFNGKAYLYWGPAPVLIWYIPIKLLTGIGIKAYFMVPFQATIGTVLLTILSYKIASSKQRVNLLGLIFVVLSIGFGTLLLFISHIPAVGVAAVSGAYCFTAMGALCLWFFLNSPQKKYWAILASLCFGLAVGSRITHIVNIVILLTACLMILRTSMTYRSKLGYAVRLLLPWALCIAMLGAYNYQRFGHPLENGVAYMGKNDDTDFIYDIMNGTIPQTNRFFLPCVTCTLSYFKPAYIPFNGYYYLLNPLRYGNEASYDNNQSPWAFHNLIPPERSPHTYIFPWLADFLIAQGFLMAGSERTYGILALSPFSLWFVAFMCHRRARKSWPPAARTLTGGLELFTILIFLFTSSFHWYAQRYSPDFSVWIMALGGIYYLHLLQRTQRKTFLWLLLIIGAATALYGVFTGFAVGSCAWDHC